MDMSLMRLALRNLLSNAIRCSPAGSQVVVRVADCDEPLALIIDVSNEGPEIPSELVVRLFERGTRRATADSSSAPGLGLGLHIVRRVMELHAGSAELVANSSARVTFRLLITQHAEG
jgi:signal transduction histidine kinase